MIDPNLIILLNNLTMKKGMSGLDGEPEYLLWLSLCELVTTYSNHAKGLIDELKDIRDTDENDGEGEPVPSS